MATSRIAADRLAILKAGLDAVRNEPTSFDEGKTTGLAGDRQADDRHGAVNVGAHRRLPRFGCFAQTMSLRSAGLRIYGSVRVFPTPSAARRSMRPMTTRTGIVALLALALAGCGGSGTTTTVIVNNGTTVGSLAVASSAPTTETTSTEPADLTIGDIAGLLDDAGLSYDASNRKGEDVDGVYSIGGSCDQMELESVVTVYVCDGSVVDPRFVVCSCKDDNPVMSDVNGVFALKDKAGNLDGEYAAFFPPNVYLRGFESVESVDDPAPSTTFTKALEALSAGLTPSTRTL